jgi:hypothetical protein
LQLLTGNGLAIFLLYFRHYIADEARAGGQAQTEVGEQLGGGRFRGCYHAQAQFGAHSGTFDRDNHVHAFDAGHLLEQLACACAQATGLHPLFEAAPEGKGKEADQDVRLHPILKVMEWHGSGCPSYARRFGDVLLELI